MHVGLGLMGVAKDNYPRDGDTYGFVAGFAEVEVDVETGVVRLVGFLGVGDVGTVDQPAEPDRRRSTAASAWASRTRCIRSWFTTRTTACRWRRASTTSR